jgi:2-haloacid dehalogenase
MPFETLLGAAGIRELFDSVVSVDDRQTFKPNPDVYAYLLKSTAASAGNTRLISSNPFDVIGAVAYGLRSVWVQRSNNTVFDPWGIESTLTTNNLSELAGGIAARSAHSGGVA